MSNNNSSTRNFIPMANKYDRVVVLVDMDCFFCQVEEKLDPSLRNKPLAVVQYNAWKGGGIIAVNYAARDKGVTRHMRGDEAKERCPDIQLVKVPNVREKADLSKYRDAGKDVANVLQRFTPLLERASVDEAYLDITEAVNKRHKEMNDGTYILQPQELTNTYASGFPSIGEFLTAITSNLINPPVDDADLYRHFNENDVPAVRQSNARLLIGASIANEIRAAVKAETTYDCSAGIAHNKILAKLACGINKPNKQTLLPLAKISELFETLPIGKIKGLGAKFGEEVCERMNVRYLGQLLKYTEVELQKKFDEKNGSWLYNICRGIDLEAVTPRFYSKSIGCCKKFPGRNSITGLKTLQHWLSELANEINERLEKDICENNRRAKQMVVNFIQEFDSEEISSSRSAPLQSYDTEVIAKTSLDIIKINTKQLFRAGSESVLNNPIKFLGISVGKFETISNSQNKIQEMFAQQAAKKKRLSADDEQEQISAASPSTSSINSDNIKNVITCPDMGKTNEKAKQLHEKSKEKKKADVRDFFLNSLKKPQRSETKVQNDEISFKSKDNITIDSKVEISQQLINNTTHIKYDHEIPSTTLNITSNSCEDHHIIEIPPKKFSTEGEINLDEIPHSIGGSFDEVYSINEDSKTILDSDVNQNNCIESKNDLINDINLMETEEKSTISTENLQIESNSDAVETSSAVSNKRKYQEISDCHKTDTQDYRSEYAEFAMPVLRPDFLQFTKCATCGAKILNDPLSIQIHQDHHWAQELSQQQRLEYRDEIRTKTNSIKSPPNNVTNKKSKKPQLKNNTIKKTLNADITKFLKPPSSLPLPSSSSSHSNQVLETDNDLNIMEICDICKVPIKRDEILEHKDFHMAKDLQRKLNQLEVRTVEIVKKPISEISRGNMNSSMIASSRPAKVAAKPITQFFTQRDT